MPKRNYEDILDRIADMLSEAWNEYRAERPWIPTPVRVRAVDDNGMLLVPPPRPEPPFILRVGNKQARQIEAALYRPAEEWTEDRAWLAVVAGIDVRLAEEYAPKLPVDMGPATLFGVMIDRVNVPDALEVRLVGGA